jgi:hypothetical protein
VDPSQHVQPIKQGLRIGSPSDSASGQRFNCATLVASKRRFSDPQQLKPWEHDARDSGEVFSRKIMQAADEAWQTR